MAYYDNKGWNNESSFLNPGPAPKPPQRSQQPLSPNAGPAYNNHTSMSTLNSPSPYTSTSNLVPIQGSNGIMQNGGGSPVSSFGDNKPIRKGWAQIKEDGIKSLIWQKKFMILREISLDFQKNEQSSSTSLSVPLRDIVSVNRVELKPYCIEIVRSANAQGTTVSVDAPKRTIYIQLKSDPELYAWIDDVYSRCPSMGGVSNPTNFTHKVHVGFDPISGGFTGLPEEWSKLLNSSAITKEDYQKNPQAVIEVLEFYTEGQGRLDGQNPFGLQQDQTPQRTPMGSFPIQNNNHMSQQSLQRQDTRERDQWQQEQERNAYREEERRREQQMREREELEQRQQQQQELQRQQERRDMERRQRQEEESAYQRQQEQDDYPQKQSTAQTQLMMGGGGGFSSRAVANPMAKASNQAKSPTKMDPQRTAPRAPAGAPSARAPAPRAPATTQLRTPQAAPAREPSPAQQARAPPKASPAATVQPLNVPKKTPVKEVTAREKKENDRRVSSMSEAQVMEKLRSVVSPGDPNQSYTKIKKVGQGASGSVYVAKINSSPASSVAMTILGNGGKNNRVAIKQMDLAHQPRKELIVNEILVMKESQHPNIVNFLDAFLKGNTELWVVMEYMEGGALTDVIDNNSLEEDQIATICFEVCCTALLGWTRLTSECRRARV